MPKQTTTVSQQDVARLVTEVINRIRQQNAPNQHTGPSPGMATQPNPGSTVRITDRVIGADTIARLPANTSQLKLPHRVVVTPSARDAARERGISLVPETEPATVASSRLLVIARVECRTDVSSLAATISRAVPASQQLPAAGLTSVLASLADHVGRNAARGLLLTDNAAVACVAANRHQAIRAVTANDVASLETASAACAANLIIVEPERFPSRILERIATALTVRESTPPECLIAETQHPGCGCKQVAQTH